MSYKEHGRLEDQSLTPKLVATLTDLRTWLSRHTESDSDLPLITAAIEAIEDLSAKFYSAMVNSDMFEDLWQGECDDKSRIIEKLGLKALDDADKMTDEMLWSRLDQVIARAATTRS